MKKLIALLLAALMMLSLAACGDKESDDKDDSGKAAVSQQTDTVSLGRVEGNTYTNTYAGFACTLDSNWTFKSAAELQELPGEAAALLTGSALEAEKIEATMIADMMAENTAELCNINVQYQKLDESQRKLFANATPEQVIDELMKQKDVLIAAYEQAGMSNVTMEKKAVTFLGESYTAALTTCSVSGVPCYILQIQDYSRGAYGVTLTVTCFGEDNTQSLLAKFTKA